MLSTRTKASLGAVALLASAAVTGATMSANAGASAPIPSLTGTQTAGQLNPLNNSGVTGRAKINVDGRRLHVEVDARRLAKNLPHAQHIHFGQKALNECPNIRADKNGDFRLTTTEGAPAYGPVRVSLTKTGDTSAKSVLAVDRFPTAPNGHVHYDRNIKVGSHLARATRHGRAVVVLHGVDYNSNGEYDFRSAGKSDLDRSLPAEATDPASCAVLAAK